LRKLASILTNYKKTTFVFLRHRGKNLSKLNCQEENCRNKRNALKKDVEKKKIVEKIRMPE
jgi:hypothetical protein